MDGGFWEVGNIDRRNNIFKKKYLTEAFITNLATKAFKKLLTKIQAIHNQRCLQWRGLKITLKLQFLSLVTLNKSPWTVLTILRFLSWPMN